MSSGETSKTLHELPRSDQAREIANQVESMLDSGMLIDSHAGETESPAVDAEGLKSLLAQIRSVASFEEELRGESVWLTGDDMSGNRWDITFAYTNETGYLLHAYRRTEGVENAYIDAYGDFDEKGEYKLVDIKVVDDTSGKRFGAFHFSTQEH